MFITMSRIDRDFASAPGHARRLAAPSRSTPRKGPTMKRPWMLTILLLVAPAASATMATEAFAGSFTASYSFTGRPGDEASVPADNQPPGLTLSDLTRGP